MPESAKSIARTRGTMLEKIRQGYIVPSLRLDRDAGDQFDGADSGAAATRENWRCWPRRPEVLENRPAAKRAAKSSIKVKRACGRLPVWLNGGSA